IEEDSASASVSIPEDVLIEVIEALSKVIWEKSKLLYEKEYINFCEWRNKKPAKGVNDKIIMANISGKSKSVKPSSLWSYYSQLKKMLSVKENVTAFLKHKFTGYKPKKSRVFTRGDLENILDKAPHDNYYLLLKNWGTGMSIDNIEDRGSVLVVTIPDTKTYKERIFTVVNGSNVIHAIDGFRKYMKLRPRQVPHQRLLLNYRNQKCKVQPIGLNTFSKMPQKIAEFLEIKDAHGYTGHSFRISSASLLAEAGADLSVLKRHIAEGYVEQSITNKIEISRKILGEEAAFDNRLGAIYV
ncbi:hypothetical protein NQ315_000626, partial [Exocentrus adspersus]